MSTWLEVLDQLERETAALERSLRRPRDVAAADAFEPPEVDGPLPVELLPRLRALLERMHALERTGASMLALARDGDGAGAASVPRYFDRHA